MKTNLPPYIFGKGIKINCLQPLVLFRKLCLRNYLNQDYHRKVYFESSCKWFNNCEVVFIMRVFLPVESFLFAWFSDTCASQQQWLAMCSFLSSILFNPFFCYFLILFHFHGKFSWKLHDFNLFSVEAFQRLCSFVGRF